MDEKGIVARLPVCGATPFATVDDVIPEMEAVNHISYVDDASAYTRSPDPQTVIDNVKSTVAIYHEEFLRHGMQLNYAAGKSEYSVARKRTDFEVLCRTPLRSASKCFISGLAPESVSRVQVRSVYLCEVEAWSFNHLVTYLMSCLVCTERSKDLNVVWCCTEVISAMGAVRNLEFACVAVCSFLVRQHGSHACQSRAEAFLLDDFVSTSRSDEVMRNNLCGGMPVALGLTFVPSHPPAVALCVFSRRFVVSLLWRLCLCSSRWSGGARATGRLSEVLATYGLQLIGLCPVSSWFFRI